MYEVTCSICGKTRKLYQNPKSSLCRSCARKKAIAENKIPKKRCAFCNEWFTPNSNKQIYCKRTHYRNCPICGKQYIEDNVENLKRPPVACSYECRAKATRQTSLNKYGCKAPGNNPEARKKAKQTMINSLGVPYAMQSEEVKAKAKKSLLDKYGVDNAGKSLDIIEKRIKTNIERYGVPAAILLPEYSPNRISKLNLKFKELLDTYGLKAELEFQIDGKFYDICLPEEKIVLEINPNYTHSSIPTHWKTSISKSYHLEKTQIAEKAGYRCIHVFDWDNWDKIINLLLPTKSIYARNCTIYKLKNEVAREFTNQHHIQRSCKGQLFCLGLVKDDELYQVMTFGRPRYNKNYSVELLRLCSKTGYRIVGGASRLFKYATQNFGLSNIISYCNYSKFNGHVYEEMEMKYLHTTPPQEIWAKENKHVTASLLRARGYDQLFGTNYGKGVSNEMLMLQNGWLPVFDCGQKVFVYD